MEQPLHRYNSELFNSEDADVVIPMLLELFPIASVVDVGCGIGTWLFSFEHYGVSDYQGLDGDHVPKDKLMVPRRRFLACDLEVPPQMGRKFDLCLSLEVAEHLHVDKADRFVNFLTSLSNIVLFSAAIPGQTGQNHYNLQWPEYWADKFNRQGYTCYDPIRPRIWRNSRVKWWYQQNMLLFVHSSLNPKLNPCTSLRRVHPDQYLKVLERLNEVKSSRRRTLWHRVKRRFL